MTRTAFVLVAALLMVFGCGDQPISALRVWMDQARKQSKPSEKKTLPLDAFAAYEYRAAGRLDPFDLKKINASALGEANAAGAEPDRQRHHEPLESYAIDQLKMVGTLRRSGYSLALIEAEKIIYQVRVGNYLGQDQGRVVKIDEKQIEIEEMVQEASGNWIGRRTQLSLKEK